MAAQALLIRYPNFVGEINVRFSLWAQSLFRRMCFKKRWNTLPVADIPDSARKEIEYLFLHDILDTTERYKIPLSLTLNLDQTPFKHAPVGNEMMASSGAKVLQSREVLINAVSLENFWLRCLVNFYLSISSIKENRVNSSKFQIHSRILI